MKTDIKFPENIITNRVHSSKVALLITIITISVMMIITARIGEFSDSSIISPLIIVATIAGIIASAVIAMSLKRSVYSQTESPLKCHTIFFSESQGDAIAKAASDNRWATIPKLAQCSSGSAMKLEVVYSNDMEFAAYQIFNYIPHSYEACSQIFYIDKEDIKRINFAQLKS